MSLTNFPYGISSFGVPVLGGMFPFTGKYIFVKPYSGLDGNDGLSPDKAVKTLTKALAVATADKNDVVFLIAESNTAASTTDYQSATLDWNKDGVHIIGINAGPMFSHRSRVALISTYVTASNLFTLSADGCFISNVSFFAGVADANPTGCFNLTGMRNVIASCHIAGIGNDANDIAGAYSLRIAGAENFITNSVIGLDTIDRGSAANSEIYVPTGATRNLVKDSYIVSRLQHSTNSPQVRVAGGAMGNPGLLVGFDGCRFLNSSTNYGYAQTYVVVHTAAPTAGFMLIENCVGVGATNWGVAGNNLILHNSATNTGYTFGVGYSS